MSVFGHTSHLFPVRHWFDDTVEEHLLLLAREERDRRLAQQQENARRCRRLKKRPHWKQART